MSKYKIELSDRQMHLIRTALKGKIELIELNQKELEKMGYHDFIDLAEEYKEFLKYLNNIPF